MMRRLLGAAVVCLLSASALALTEAEARAGGVERAEDSLPCFDKYGQFKWRTSTRRSPIRSSSASTGTSSATIGAKGRLARRFALSGTGVPPVRADGGAFSR